MRLIDADAAADLIDYMLDEGNLNMRDPRAVRYNVKLMLTEEYYTPTINPVRHGRWVKPDLWTKPVCSVCGEPCFGLHGFSYETTDYCPNCGARMEGEEG